MNGRHIDDLLPEYAAGILPAELEAEVESHLQRCAACVHELHALEDVYAQIPLALPAPPPPPQLRARLLRSVGDEGRFARFIAQVGAMLDVGADRARDLLALIDRAASWQDGPAGTRLIHLAVGPRVAHANCGFLRLRAGGHFPHHRHLGVEHVLVLQGGLIDSSGRTVHAGEEELAPAGSEHSFTALADVDLIFLVVLETGLEMAGSWGEEI